MQPILQQRAHLIRLSFSLGRGLFIGAIEPARTVLVGTSTAGSYHPKAIVDDVHVRAIHGNPVKLAGHSKWANVKRDKAAADMKRARLTVKVTSRIINAVHLGGGTDPVKNQQLAGIIAQARSLGIPKVTIEKAVQGGSRQSDGAKPVMFEGRGKNGYKLLIETLTNKINRTRREIKMILEKHGGGLGEPGSSSFEFERKGVVRVPREELSRLTSDPFDLAIEIGAEDILEDGDHIESVGFKCDPVDMSSIAEAVREKGGSVDSATLEYLPKTVVELSPDHWERAEKLLEALTGHAEVVEVHTNFVLEKPA